MCGNNNFQENCLAEIFETILMLQQQDNTCDIENGCTKPFLGPINNIICFNTRPITIYSCCENTLWTMPYTLNGVSSTSSVFRIENLDDECATFRVLAVTDPTAVPAVYTSTNDFFTIKLSCIGSIKCLSDTNISGV